MAYKREPYDPSSTKPFKISRSKIDLYINCPRCFYLDCRLGISRPSMPAFTLNIAVDTLLKKEFDLHRIAGSKHPLMEKYGLQAIPVGHEKLEQWRFNFSGIQCLHEKTNLFVFGAIDDLWQNEQGEYIVVDYKATSKDGEVELTDAKWHQAYRRQMEIYQWLLRKNNLTVSNTGYFVYVNGKKDRKAFDGKLEFDIKLIAYTGSDAWVEQTLFDIRDCLRQNTLPLAKDDCEYCAYRSKTLNLEQPSIPK